ncbi:uncharacterized protein LOC110739151 [Chenopodium quinoa]|uniref:DUF1279 domain-containing protein n=1 Tax=Chenopodium quinoa TaxID=63459 RepID=A0A803LGC2_CHEQI|nr:uncharacterized protein LOC110739151 [Chenopodium quinoa]
MASTGRFRQILKKYGKVGLGVHFSVSAASISGLYVAIKNNVDVEALLHKVGMGGVNTNEQPQIPENDPELIADIPSALPSPPPEKTRNRTAELAASSGGAFALALLCNKALFPIRVPITIALTPPIARFLARRNLIRSV